MSLTAQIQRVTTRGFERRTVGCLTTHMPKPLHVPRRCAGRTDVESAEQIQSIMARGFEQRAVGCHDVNAHSSRSHCLLVVHVAATDPTTGALK